MKYITCVYFIFIAQLALADARFSAPLDDLTLVEEAKGLMQTLALTATDTTKVLHRITVDINGSIMTTRRQSIWFYPTSADVDNFGTDSVSFSNATQSLRINMSASLQPDGTVTVLNAGNIQLTQADGYNTFSDRQVAYLPVPALTKGSFAILDVTHTEDMQRFQGGLSAQLYVERGSPVLTTEIAVRWQNNDIAVHNSYPDLKCHKTPQSITCSASDTPKLDIKDNEFWRDQIRGLHIGENKTWPQIITDFNKLYERAFEQSDKVDELFARITHGLDTEADKINAIFRFVSEEIRYVSLSSQGHTHQPHANDSVIENLFGDCKDKTALLHRLLEKLGIVVEPYLVATDRTRLDALKLPSLGYFNHIILCFDHFGNRVCLDPTDTYTHWFYPSAWIQGKVGLPLTEGAQPELLPKSFYRWQLNVNTQIFINDEGGLEETQERTYLGEYAAHMREYLQNANADDRNDNLVAHYQEVVADIDSVTAELLTPLDGDRHQFVVQTEAQYGPFLSLDSAVNYYETDAWILDELNAMDVDDSANYAEIPGYEIISNFEITLASGWRYKKPTPTLHFPSQYGWLTRQSHIEGNTMYVETKLRVKNGRLEKEQLADFNQFISALTALLEIRADQLTFQK